MRTALTIAGSDSGGGAGIQADIKTMTVHGVYAMSAVTALTAQNTVGVYQVEAVAPEFLGRQLDCIFTDIYPDAVKIGMLPSREHVRITAEKLKQYGAKHVVLDPVMISSSGTGLMSREAQELLIKELFPLAELVTPNLPETEALTGREIHSREDMITACRRIAEDSGCKVLCKGGHRPEDADDLLWLGEGRSLWLAGKRISNPNTHGTGCTLSSAIASNLALGFSMEDAVRQAKEYLTRAIAAGLNLGKGSGPLNHMCQMHTA